MTTLDTINEAKSFFVRTYVADLTDRLTRKAEDDELDSVLDGDMIDGGLLCGCDETAYSATMQEYGWRVGCDELREAVNGPEIYEGIDYAAIIATAKGLQSANA